MFGVPETSLRRRAYRPWVGMLGWAMMVIGCATPLGGLPMIGGGADAVAVKLLRPRAVGQSCRTSILGAPLRPGSPTLDEALTGILALDPEGDVVTHAEITTVRFATGVYNRRCIVVRGDVGRLVRSITLPVTDDHSRRHLR